MEVNGNVLGTYIPSEPTGATAVPGVWVAGNVANLQAQVITSAAAGLHAAGQLNVDLIAEDVRLAVTAARHQHVAPSGEHDWDGHYRAHPTLWSGRPNPPLVAE